MANVFHQLGLGLCVKAAIELDNDPVVDIPLT
jgi:hypothetical protein